MKQLCESLAMKYRDLLDKVDELEEETELAECMYFGAVEKLKDVQRDLTKLDDVQHMRRVIKPFLTQWGMMGRVVERKGLRWMELGETLRSLEKEFKQLWSRSFLTIEFNEEKISKAIKNIYSRLDPIPYIGGPTSIPKILHLLNPEIFVMWNTDIRENYRKKNNRIRDTPEGYLEFLIEVKEELKEAIYDRQKESGKELDRIEQEIRSRYKNKTLARIVDEYNWIVAHPFR